MAPVSAGADLIGQVPVEIATLIIEDLEELDLAPQPFSDITETANYLVVPKFHQEHLTWVVYTNASRDDICNARLASRNLYSASLKSFGRLLGDRKFRLTKTGMEDLKGISEIRSLMPYIRTLTFGTAGFLQPDHEALSRVMCSLKQWDRHRRITEYNHCAEWQQKHRLSLHGQLGETLRQFPLLKSVRIVMTDFPFELGGWTGLAEAIYTEDQSARNYDDVHEVFGLYKTRVSHITYQIFKALKRADTVVEGIRLSWGTHYRWTPKWLTLFPGLRTLRIAVKAHNLNALGPTEPSLPKVLIAAINLEDLALVIDGKSLFREHGHFLMDYDCNTRESMSSNLFDALHNHKRLRRVEFGTGWVFTEAKLVAFITRHSEILRCLIFRYPYLTAGSWLSTLSSVESVT